MLPMYFKVTTTGWPGMRKRQLNRCIKAAWKAVGKYWCKHMLPKHFTHAGALEYGYHRRGHVRPRLTYDEWKRRKVGHSLPLVYTGDLERQVTSPARQGIHPSRTGLRITLRHDVRHKSVHDELTRVSRGEIKRLKEVFHEAFAKALNDFKGRTVRRVA